MTPTFDAAGFEQALEPLLRAAFGPFDLGEAGYDAFSTRFWAVSDPCGYLRKVCYYCDLTPIYILAAKNERVRLGEEDPAYPEIERFNQNVAIFRGEALKRLEFLFQRQKELLPIQVSSDRRKLGNLELRNEERVRDAELVGAHAGDSDPIRDEIQENP